MPERLTRSQLLFVALVCLLFGLQFGFNFAISNQNQYLLPALKELHPELFTRDWSVNQTTTYHILFPAISKMLLLFSPIGWWFGIMNLLVSSLVGLFIFLITRELVEPKNLFATILTVIAISTWTGTESAAGVYITSNIFQPSSIGALGFLAGIYFFLRGSYLLSSVCLAIGGINHANYLMLSFPVFGLAHLLLGKDTLIARLFKQFTLPALALIPFIPFLLTMADSPDAPLANRVYVDIRLPHHHNPAHFWPTLIPIAVGLLAAILLGWKELRIGRRLTNFQAIGIAMLTGIILGIIATTVFGSYSVARFMPWRTIPFVSLFVQIIAVAGGIRLLTTERIAQRVPQLGRLILPIAVLVWGVVTIPLLTAMKERSNLLRDVARPEAELYVWAHTTPVDALFCVPPLMEEFRIKSERSIVGDWKPAPSLPSEVVEWYHRMEAISGRDGFTHMQHVYDGYNAMGDERMRMLRERYGVDYVVLRRDLITNEITAPVVFENDLYLVFSMK